ncbi:hypothetical protein BX600DRAFT_454609 [Xylariales sp. PMI_506]|nr:hypothetical protein BX600DRAFT_454609 [Xylariales sp. PMI_506]
MVQVLPRGACVWWVCVCVVIKHWLITAVPCTAANYPRVVDHLLRIANHTDYWGNSLCLMARPCVLAESATPRAIAESPCSSWARNAVTDLWLLADVQIPKTLHKATMTAIPITAILGV